MWYPSNFHPLKPTMWTGYRNRLPPGKGHHLPALRPGGAEGADPEGGGRPHGHLPVVHLPAGKAHHLPAEEGDPAAELTLDNRTGVYYTKIKYGKLRGREAVSGGQRPRERTAGVSSPKAAGEVVPEHRSRSISKPRRRPTVDRAGANAPQSAGFPESRWYHGHLFALSRKAQGVLLCKRA